MMRLSLVGGFHKPGLYYINPRASYWQAIALGGGPVREDGIKKIRWERNGQIIKYDLVSGFETGQTLEDIGIQSGDQLCVTPKPKAGFWDIFNASIFPLLSLGISAATAYFSVETYLKTR
jgi:protein involved in polysaccharide export with SLBB domain